MTHPSLRLESVAASIMKVVFACVLFLCVLRLGVALKCYRCEPDFEKIGGIMANETAANATEAEKKLNDFLTCKGSIDTIECPAERDGLPLDVCSSIEFGMSITPPGLNKSLNIKMAMKNCSFSMMCADTMKKMLCDGLKNSLSGTGFVTPGECKINCCQEDLCDTSMPKSTPGSHKRKFQARKRKFQARQGKF